MWQLIKFSSFAGILALTACVSPEYQHTANGAAIGSVAGAIIGHQLDDEDGRYYGAAAGALVGGAIGNNMDNAHRYPQQSSYYQPNDYDSYYSNSNNYYDQYPYNQYQNGYSNQQSYRQPYYYQQNNGYAPYPPPLLNIH